MYSKLQHQKSDQWLPGYKKVELPRGIKKHLGVMAMCTILSVVMVFYVYTHTFKCIKLYTLNICYLMYTGYASIKVYRKLKEIDWNTSNLPQLSYFIGSIFLSIPTFSHQICCLPFLNSPFLFIHQGKSKE